MVEMDGRKESAEEIEEFVPTRAYFHPVIKSKNLSLVCSYQFYLPSFLAEFSLISAHLHQQ